MSKTNKLLNNLITTFSANDNLNDLCGRVGKCGDNVRCEDCVFSETTTHKDMNKLKKLKERINCDD